MRFYFYILLNTNSYLNFKKIILKNNLKLSTDRNEKYVFLCNNKIYVQKFTHTFLIINAF